MVAQECTRLTQEFTRVAQEANSARETRRVEVFMPKQIKMLEVEIEKAASVGEFRTASGDRMYPETQAHFESLGFTVEHGFHTRKGDWRKVSWGPKTTKHLAKKTLFWQLFNLISWFGRVTRKR